MTAIEGKKELNWRGEKGKYYDYGYKKGKEEAQKEIFDKLDIAFKSYSIAYVMKVVDELKQSLSSHKEKHKDE